MATAEERMRILKMIESKQISAEDGARLLAALNAGAGETRPPAGGRAGAARWLRVRVTNTRTGKLKVNITIPLSLVEVGMRMGARYAPELQATDLQAVQDAIRQGVQGKILETEDTDDYERVEIFVE